MTLERKAMAARKAGELLLPVWRDQAGAPLSCVEKIKVLNENLDELQQIAQDALEDALLMGVDEQQIRAVLNDMVRGLVNPYDRLDQK